MNLLWGCDGRPCSALVHEALFLGNVPGMVKGAMIVAKKP